MKSEPSGAAPRAKGKKTRDEGDLRADERHDVPGLIEIEVELFGYQRDGRPFGTGRVPDSERKINTFGTTVNLSLSGMLATIADPITEGSHCLVRFVNAGNAVLPELRWGLVLRCYEVEPGGHEVAVNFDSPLERLDVDPLVVG